MSEAGPSKRPIAADLSKRACDCCRFRKIKCDKQHPCATCIAMELDCTYNTPRRKRGPPGKRVGEIQRQQRQAGRIPAFVKKETSYTRPYASSIDEIYDRLQKDASSSPPTAYTIRNPTPQQMQGDYFIPQTYDDSTSSGGTVRVENDVRRYTHSQSPSVSLNGKSLGSPPMYNLDEDNNVPLGMAGDLSSSCSGLYDMNTLQQPLQIYSNMTNTNANLSNTNANIAMSPIPSMSQSYETAGSQTLGIWPTSIDDASLFPLIDIFFERLHATIPVLNRTTLYQRLILLEHRHNSHFAAMLLSLCAFALTQPLLISERALSQSRNSLAKMMMHEAVKMQDCADFGEDPTLEAVLCSFFLFATLFGSSSHNAAWLRLREAVTLGDMLGLHDPSSYTTLNHEDRACRLRTYWILCVTERAYAMQRRHPIEFKGEPGVMMRSMHDFINNTPPDQLFGFVGQDEMDATGMVGLKQLMEIFDAFNEDVVDCWNERCKGASSCKVMDQDRIVSLHTAQAKVYRAWDDGTDNTLLYPVPSYGHKLALKETQKADVLITRQWLLNRLWQLAFSHNLLQARSNHPELQFDYAETIAQNTVNVFRNLSLSSMEVHGIGLVEKLYDIASSAITAFSCFPNDLTATLPVEQQTYFASMGYSPTSGPQPYSAGVSPIRVTMNEYMILFTEFRGGDHPYLSKLIARMKALPPPSKDEIMYQANSGVLNSLERTFGSNLSMNGGADINPNVNTQSGVW